MKRFFLSLLAVAGMLTACNMNELESVNRMGDRIGFTTTTNGLTKAVDVTTANLTAFTVEAFNHNTVTSPYMNAVAFTGANGSFESAEPYYWPEGALDFYAYSQGTAEGQVVKSDYRTFNITPAASPAAQVDFVYAGVTNQTKAGSTEGAIPLNFRHTESKIVVQVKNTAPNLKFVVDAWKVGYLDEAGTFTYNGNETNAYDATTVGAGTLDAGMWTNNTTASASNTYTNTLASSVNIAASSSSPTPLGGEMILIPQVTTAADAYASASASALVNGSYVAVKIKILNRANDAVIYSDGNGGSAWAIWPVAFNWEPGKKYTYTLDLAGGGYYEVNNDTDADLDPILEGAVISFASVTVDEFAAQSAIPVPVPANGHAYVDLGLRSGGNKILFATMNIGASSATEYGDYFAWGETSKRYTSISGTSIIGSNFNFSNAPFFDGSVWTKYNNTDNKRTLDAADDVASVMWGGNWRMPDMADLQFLLNSTYCTAAWTADYNSTGVAGLVVTGKGDYAGNSIFFPAAGLGRTDSILEAGNCGFYWSRSADEGVPSVVYYLDFPAPSIVGEERFLGHSVRPVLVIPE